MLAKYQAKLVREPRSRLPARDLYPLEGAWPFIPNSMKLRSARQRNLEVMNSKNIVEAHRSPWVASLAFGVALSGMASPVFPVDSQTGIPVTTALAEKAVRPAILEASGQVVAWEEASVSVSVTGLPVVEVYARVGDHVKKGQL